MAEVNVQSYGAVGDNFANDTTPIQNAINAVSGGGTVYFPKGTYRITSGLSMAGGSVRFRGDSHTASVIAGDFAGTMLTLSGNVSALAGGLVIENLGFDRKSGTSTPPTRAIDLQNSHYFRLESVRMADIDGTALFLDNVEDATFIDLRATHCGKYANSLPAIRIGNTGNASNSLVFMGCHVERPYYTGIYCSATQAVKFIGCKFHGRTETNANAVDCLQIANGQRAEIIGCQFSNVRRHGIYVTDANANLAATIVGNTFNEAINYQTGGAAWFIVLENGLHNVSGNEFMAAGTVDASYGTRGGDIWLKSTARGAVGENIHRAAAGAYVQNDIGDAAPEPLICTSVIPTGSDAKALMAKAWKSYRETTNQAAYQSFLNGEAYARFDIQSQGRLRWGSGGAAADVTLERSAADRLALGTGDELKLDSGAWNSGHLLMGGYHLWVDAAGRLRIKSGAPVSDTDGAVVGSQS